MKKIISALSVVMLLIASAASCQKGVPCEERALNVSMRYSFDISVNGGPGFDYVPTKAVKTGWENGDKIYLFFKPSEASMLTDTYAAMVYNGTSWNTTMSKSTDLKKGGQLSAVYVPCLGNTVVPIYQDGKWNIASGDVYYNAATTTYQVDVTKVKATLNMAIPKDYVQFYINGIENKDVLTCNNVDSFNDITIDNKLAVASKTKTADGKMSCRKFSAKDDGFVFYGRLKSTLPADCQLSVTKDGMTYRRIIQGKKLAHKAYNLGAFSTSAWTPVLLTEDFSVSASKKVRFSCGNLYWNGSVFEFEKDQLSYPNSWDSNHVGHFYWTTAAANAYAVNYAGGGEKSTDVLFTNNGGLSIYGQTGWRTLSKDEWQYLLTDRPGGKSKCPVTVDGKKGLVIAPDNFSGDINQTYTAGGWADVEKGKGLVFLPLTGLRKDTGISNADITGYYWTGTGLDDDAANYVVFNNSFNIEDEARSNGRAIRLAKYTE